MSEPQDVEERIRERLAAGDVPAAFSLMFEAYGGTIDRLVRALPTREQAEDISQDIWIAVQQGLPGFKFECPPRGWLVRVARNTIADFWRRRSRQFNHYEPDDPVFETLVTRFGGPPSMKESIMDRDARIAALRIALDGIDPAERELVWDRYVLQISPADIVRERGLDKTPNALAQQIHRLVEKLKNVVLK